MYNAHYFGDSNRFKNANMKKFLMVSLLFILGLQISCEKDDDSAIPIQVVTDKIYYLPDEDVVVEVSNTSDSAARYYICSSYKTISPSVYRFENNKWTIYWSPICDGFISRCCGELPSDSTYTDTLAIDFEPGYYRIEYMFIFGAGHEYNPYFSNQFQIE